MTKTANGFSPTSLMNRIASSTTSVLACPGAGPTGLPIAHEIGRVLVACIVLGGEPVVEPEVAGRRLDTIEPTVQMPLARQARRVAGAPEALNDADLGSRQVDARSRFDPVAHADPVGMCAREEGRPRR